MEKDKQGRKLKLIWDFRGPDAERTAKHHALHLKEYVEAQDLPLQITGFEQINDSLSIAYLVVYENEMIAIRDTLKPHRGQIYDQ